MSKNYIELPTMPEWAMNQRVENAVHAYTIAAIKADRQRRCEPVAWHTEDHLTDKSATTYDPVVAKRWIEKGWPVTPLFYAPQPSTPTQSMNKEISQFLADVMTAAGLVSHGKRSRR